MQSDQPQGLERMVRLTDKFPLEFQNYDPETRTVTYTQHRNVPIFDKHGHIFIYDSIREISSCGPIYYFGHPLPIPGGETFWFLDYNKISNKGNISMVAFWAQLKYDRSFYDVDSHSNRASYDIAVARIGSKGFLMTYDMYPIDRKQCMFQMKSNLVFFNTKARAVSVLPGIDPTVPSVDVAELPDMKPVKALVPPDHAFSKTLPVLWHTTDFNQHLYFASYNQVAYDVLMLALASPNEQPNWKLNDDNIQAGLREIKVVYIKECFHGDDITITVWQNEDDDESACCTLSNKDNEDICKILLYFYQPLMNQCKL